MHAAAGIAKHRNKCGRMHLTNIYIKAEKLFSMRHPLSHNIKKERHTAATSYGRTLTMRRNARENATTADT